MPSQDRGGGIERYLEFVYESVRTQGLTLDVVAVLKGQELPTLRRKFAYLIRVFRAAAKLRKSRPVFLLIGHVSLGAASILAVRLARLSPERVLVVYYGQEALRIPPRTKLLLQLLKVEGFAISDFTAGLAGILCEGNVLFPGLAQAWFDKLRSMRPAPIDNGKPRSGTVMTAFRLDAAHAKGLAQIIDAMELLRHDHPDARLVVAGTGRLPSDAESSVANRDWIQVHQDVPDSELSQLYANADVFVLATQSKFGRLPNFEGFGLVLVEAQLAGTAVIAPCRGGISSAFVEGVTGIRPTDESAAALYSALRSLLDDPETLTRMSQSARMWATTIFHPEQRSAAALAQLLYRGRVVSRTDLRIANINEDER
jgi:phosphatidyl-myo-inositol dimannoside synthase